MGRLQVRAGLGFHTRGLCSFSPGPPGRGFRPQLPLGSDDAHLPAARGAPESARFFAEGKARS